MKILIIRLSAIGDTIHALPVAATIRRLIPEAQIGWIVEPPSAPLLIGNPAVDRVHVLHRKEWIRGLLKPWQWSSSLGEIGDFWAEVRAQGYEVTLDVQGLLKSAVCAAASGARHRYGFSCTREGAGLFLTERVDAGDYFGHARHVVDMNMELATYMCWKVTGKRMDDAAMIAEFPLPHPPDSSVGKMRRMLGGVDVADKRMVRNVVLIPGSTWNSKIWPEERWSELAKMIASGSRCRIALVGGKADAGRNARITRQLHQDIPGIDALDLTLQTSLLDLIALFKQSDLVVGADTGPLHLAAATGACPVVGIFGSTPVGRNGPYGDHCHSVALSLWCQPCFSRVCPLSTTACLRDLSVRQVYETVRKTDSGYGG